MEYVVLQWSQGSFLPRNAYLRDHLSVACLNTLIPCGSLNCVENSENSFWLSLYSSNILIESSSTSQYRICLYMEAIIIILYWRWGCFVCLSTH